ncbi:MULTISPECIES: TetR/AcrR family transcriptional regulator [Mycobacterium]|uniref:Transcriptional regulator n=1 Tax=Mycobacterium intracellulare subsp. chimaera TaxID=222805 RepID=A0A220YJI3_MYCIT|nr:MULTISPECIES: TetR family transcriptional regulator [Mycobacterium]AOS94043.1 TetR family transcriptional regulator [Mycobacterium intracellulare subsp. chimaera]ARV84564.1 TetR family transcriptional regulator [Mycobacterium intracellulare subsp. chimaera]ASL11921.1 transcriptional regulator [Mycobacterium intracellulare subsp. chimaera]ASL17837.1 transcriptional regulator [Mycobacterium intracellulare subsp. chimaera]ASL23870.1 transcriptional regulator [Mycobacterium intracellulare subsp
MPAARRAGRWRTGQVNRQRIIEAARERFMRDGYERATVRAIAADAGVDVAMVYYFFGNKEGLFTASTLTGPEHPLHQLATLLDEGTERVGERLARRFLEHWEQGAVFEPFLTLWRSAAIHPEARKVLHDSLAGPIAERVATEFGVADAELRVELVASHLAGLAFARYQLKIEPLASTSIEDLVGRLGPTLQRYLTD